MIYFIYCNRIESIQERVFRIIVDTWSSVLRTAILLCMKGAICCVDSFPKCVGQIQLPELLVA